MGLKHWMTLALAIGVLWAADAGSPTVPRPATSQGHDHEAHPHSPLEAKFKQAIERETGFEMDGHAASEGPVLKTDFSAHTQAAAHAGRCPEGVPTKLYDVVAIEIVMVLNRWGDRDPDAFMFALRERLPAIRAQEALANDPSRHYGLSLGMGEDAIQPLVLRANVGDCVRVRFTNELDEPASFHVHGTDFVLSGTGEPALSSNPNAVALPAATVGYEWYVDPAFYGENTHYVHSHGPKGRFQVSHGLFGALIVEPAGSIYFDQRSGLPLCGDPATVAADGSNLPPETSCRNAWEAMISPGDGPDFREFVMIYHEIGNALFLTVDGNGIPNLSIDPIAQAYKPNGRGINYRSESFWRRLSTAEAFVGFADESQAYGTYAFGDPAMPVPQSYLGDPVKFRLMHGGSETFHVPHLHGGGIQWQRQQNVGKDSDPDYTPIDAGLKKHFAARMPSSGNDSQTIGPSETYELEIGCGSGGCQQTVGDFLFHCHVASHYIAGMWHFWRVYNTLQIGDFKTDDLAELAELPDRAGRVQPAVTSTQLLGTTVDFAGQTVRVDEDNLAGVIEPQLPPQGVPNDLLDAQVMNWAVDGTLYLNEPETELSWPNFTSPAPGERFPFRFDPATGKLAFPFLRPHLGQRPPFAPHHGPAPYLEPLDHERGRPAAPGVNGPDSLCPEGAPQRFYKIHAIQTEIPVTDTFTDQDGMIYVLKEHEAQARTDPEFKVPLAIRANQGDCVDVVFVNELENAGDPFNLNKSNIHIHFVQFDTQASDGVITGASYEQAPRPFIDPGMSFFIQADVNVGADRIVLDDASSFHPGTTVALGVDQQVEVFETAVVASIEGDTLVFERPLENAHAAGERVSAEFVQYRWYVARQNGAIYYHDHVDALIRWSHGLFGALIAEPGGSTWHDPRTGEEISSGPVADIHVPTDREVVPGLQGSFREFVLFMIDRQPVSHFTNASFNLRSEPLWADTPRGQGPPQYALSSVTHGDPATPLLRAYTGDPVFFRLLTTATEEIHPFHLTGHRFRFERFQADSLELTSFGVGISERFNAYVEAAGGPARKAGDYLYYNGSDRHFIDGAWGILRVHDTQQDDLQPLPRRTPPSGPGFPQLTVTGQAPPPAVDAGDPCPADAPRRHYAVSAIELPLVFNEAAGMDIPNGRLFVLDEDADAVLGGQRAPVPLVIRVNAGECLTLGLTNRLAASPASIHLDALALDPQGSLGITLGFNPDQAVEPGEQILYRYYADREVGTVRLRDFGTASRNVSEGLYGGLIVEPEGAVYLDPGSGRPLRSGLEAIIQSPQAPDFREFVTVFHDSDPDIGLFLMPYDEEVNRLVGVNYRAEPLKLRLEPFDVIRDQDPIAPENWAAASALFDSAVYGDPGTGVFQAFTGDPLRFRVISGFSQQPQVFSVEGHRWTLTPSLLGSAVVHSRYLPSSGVLDVVLLPGKAPPGDYEWSNHRMPYEKAGQWGMLRLASPGTNPKLHPLSDRMFVAPLLSLDGLSVASASTGVAVARALELGITLASERSFR